MVEHPNARIARRLWEATSEGDANAIREILAPDVRWCSYDSGSLSGERTNLGHQDRLVIGHRRMLIGKTRTAPRILPRGRRVCVTTCVSGADGT